MKKIFLLVAAAALMAVNVQAQFKINSVTFYGDYSTIFSKKSELKVNSMKGPGGELEIKFDLFDKFKLSVNSGYKSMDIDQEVHAMFAQWNWRAWKRYFGDINDVNMANFYNKYVQLLLADTANYAGTFTPVQSIEVYPVIITASYELNPAENIAISPSLGGGVIFFYKSLYVEEHWKKFFSQLGQYTFDYSFRNMADKVRGNPYVLSAGLDADYTMNEYIKLSAGARYTYVIPSGESFGNKDFPAKDLLNIRLGISFEY